MLLIPTYLATSGIHGIGVFAAADIPAGTRVWEFTPGLDIALTADQIKAQPPLIFSFLRHYYFALKAQTGTYVLAADNCRFINHSETPNLADDGHDRDYSLRFIQKGEELFCDYHKDHAAAPVFNWKPGDALLEV